MAVDKTVIKQLFLSKLQEVSKSGLAAYGEYTKLFRFYEANELNVEGAFVEADMVGSMAHLEPIDIGTMLTGLQTIGAAMTPEILADMSKFSGEPV